MLELGQLERYHDEFARRNTRIVAVSMDDTTTSQKTQADFPHLLVLADKSHHLADSTGILVPHEGPNGEDANAPTTILVDRQGIVRWLYRPSNAMIRLSPQEVLEVMDQHSTPPQ